MSSPGAVSSPRQERPFDEPVATTVEEAHARGVGAGEDHELAVRISRMHSAGVL